MREQCWRVPTTICKTASYSEAGGEHRKLIGVLWEDLAVGRRGWEGGSREGIYAYLQLMHAFI